MRRSGIRLFITALALALIAARIQWPSVAIDATTVALLIVAVAPWLWEFIESAEFPGGWKFHFREVQSEQQRQKAEIESLKFLVTHFLTEAELTHLKKLAAPDPFYFEPSPFFQSELRHLRALGLIAGHHNKGIRSLLEQKGDAKNHFFVTERGRDYLKLREQAEQEQAENPQ